MKQEQSETTSQLLELQRNMQELLAKQIKQQEDTKNKGGASSVKLPKIDMISFSGDRTKWVEFWDSFTCAVHNNKTLSDIEKFTYLRSKLEGEAKGSIAGLALTNDNYKEAIDILNKRFGNPQEIIDLN